ncbi:hypothetical protein COPEUT_01903 [Coprococcus eutactus ATCC 27759]|nr:hypothetical protein COPEUT_01903 [Coprococcus eutactus ATCC 27759]
MPEESPVHNEKNKKLIMPTEPTSSIIVVIPIIDGYYIRNNE